jgi:hypothetical protein
MVGGNRAMRASIVLVRCCRGSMQVRRVSLQRCHWVWSAETR